VLYQVYNWTKPTGSRVIKQSGWDNERRKRLIQRARDKLNVPCEDLWLIPIYTQWDYTPWHQPLYRLKVMGMSQAWSSCCKLLFLCIHNWQTEGKPSALVSLWYSLDLENGNWKKVHLFILRKASAVHRWCGVLGLQLYIKVYIWFQGCRAMSECRTHAVCL